MATALAAIGRHDAIGVTVRRAGSFAATAAGALSAFPDGAFRRSLLGVADYTVRRAR